jgi:thioester reductase-like protein
MIISTPTAISSVSSILEILMDRSKKQSKQIAYVFLSNGETESSVLTYQELDQQARSIAAELQSMELKGERALLLYSSELEFISAFFGCLYAGVIAVPLYPPRRNQKLSRLQAITKDAQAKVALTSTPLLISIEEKLAKEAELANLTCIATDNLNNGLADQCEETNLALDDLAFLQYTSGSTGIPKGVMISHGNLLHNQHLIAKGFGHTEDTIGVNWLPLFHDMGLIGNILQAVYVGRPCIIMPPEAFVQKPIRWLKAISDYKATISGGPNFAYELCAAKITPQEQETLDLSSWEVAFTGAEPVRASTLEKFSSTFASCGFRKEAFYPCYGMAESTLFISGGIKTESPVVHSIKKEALQENCVVKVEPESIEAQSVTSCGKAWSDGKILIVSPNSQTQCHQGQVGEIWVSSPSVAQGYWNRTEETEKTFRAYLADSKEGPFLRTGDLGFLDNGELFITGRSKDVIIIRGRNHYPQDIEQTVEKCHEALRLGAGAAFSITIADEEKLVIVQEVERTYLRNLDANPIFESICRAISEEYEIQVYAIALIKTASIPKTSSGKIQRYSCREHFLAGTLDVAADWSLNPKNKSDFLKLEQDIESLNKKLRLHPQKSSSSNIFDRQSKVQKDNISLEMIQSWFMSQLGRHLNLESEKIDLNKSFNDYGFDSLQSMNLIGELENFLGCQINPSLIWECETIQKFTRYLTGDERGSFTTSLAQMGVDLKAEVNLDPSISVENMLKITLTDSSNIFLTGSTGFLGAFLLSELLKQTHSKIYCLVRSLNVNSAQNKIQESLALYGLWQTQFIGRIIPVVGDLSEPLLGLSQEQFEKLASEIDVIYHSGALLNYVYPYERLKQINVSGTQEILRFASTKKIKQVNYMSSIAVFESDLYRHKIITESDELMDVGKMYLGYSQSKWVAEKLVLLARERGLPVIIYRLPFISGHSLTGVWNTDDIICRMIKGCITMKKIPNLDYVLNMAPVDYIVQSILLLSKKEDALGRIFHLINPDPMHLDSIQEQMNSIGYKLDRLSFQDWLNNLQQNSESNVLYPLLPFFMKQYLPEKLTILELYQEQWKPNVTCQETMRILADSSIYCPSINDNLLNKYFAHFIRTGFLNYPDYPTKRSVITQ